VRRIPARQGRRPARGLRSVPGRRRPVDGNGEPASVVVQREPATGPIGRRGRWAPVLRSSTAAVDPISRWPHRRDDGRASPTSGRPGPQQMRSRSPRWGHDSARQVSRSDRVSTATRSCRPTGSVPPTGRRAADLAAFTGSTRTRAPHSVSAADVAAARRRARGCAEEDERPGQLPSPASGQRQPSPARQLRASPRARPSTGLGRRTAVRRAPPRPSAVRQRPMPSPDNRRRLSVASLPRGEEGEIRRVEPPGGAVSPGSRGRAVAIGTGRPAVGRGRKRRQGGAGTERHDDRDQDGADRVPRAGWPRPARAARRPNYHRRTSPPRGRPSLRRGRASRREASPSSPRVWAVTQARRA
jgi:hypothetical protein